MMLVQELNLRMVPCLKHGSPCKGISVRIAFGVLAGRETANLLIIIQIYVSQCPGVSVHL